MSSQGSGRSRTLFILCFVLCLFFLSTVASAQQYKVTAIEPPFGYTASRAMGINNLGEVVGRFFNIDPATGEAADRRAFVWDSTNGAWLLPALGGESCAWTINDNGIATGFSYNNLASQSAVLWDARGLTVTEIGAFTNQSTSERGDSSTAYGINAYGEMVGIMWDRAEEGATEHAFIFDAQHGVRNLNDLIDSSAGWLLNFGRDINDNGQIVGYGELDGQKRAIILHLNTPSAPVLLSPANGSNQGGTSVTFSWQAVSGAHSYWLYVGDASVIGFTRFFIATSCYFSQYRGL